MRANAVTPGQRRTENALIRRALKVLEDRLEYERVTLNSPQAVRDYLRLRMAELEHEIFVAIWLDAGNQVIECDELFRGTVAATSVYPREVVKRGLLMNASAVIVAHNHPSGRANPSTADRELTRTLKAALELVDIKLLDHFIVAGAKAPFSFVEGGLL